MQPPHSPTPYSTPACGTAVTLVGRPGVIRPAANLPAYCATTWPPPPLPARFPHHAPLSSTDTPRTRVPGVRLTDLLARPGPVRPAATILHAQLTSAGRILHAPVRPRRLPCPSTPHVLQVDFAALLRQSASARLCPVQPPTPASCQHGPTLFHGPNRRPDVLPQQRAQPATSTVDCILSTHPTLIYLNARERSSLSNQRGPVHSVDSRSSSFSKK